MSSEDTSTRIPLGINDQRPIVIGMGNVTQPGLSGQMVPLGQKTWVASDGKTAVADGDPRARFLLGLAGDEIPLERAIELGLIGAEDEDEDEEDLADPPEKRDTPERNKQRQPTRNK